MTQDEKWREVQLSLLEQERRKVFDRIRARVGFGTRVSRLILDIVSEDPEWRHYTNSIEKLKQA